MRRHIKKEKEFLLVQGQFNSNKSSDRVFLGEICCYHSLSEIRINCKGPFG